MSGQHNKPLFGNSAGQETHRLTLSITISPYDSRANCTLIAIVASLRGEPNLDIEGQIVDIAGLTSAQEETGEHVIFTCGCGDPGCAGYGPVRASAHEELLEWSWRHGPHERIAIMNREQANAEIYNVLELVRVLASIKAEYGQCRAFL